MVWIANGTANNDAIEYRVTTVTAAQLTLEHSGEVTSETAVSRTYVAFHRDTDGMPRFPGPRDSTNLIRSGGFTGGITGAPFPYLGVAFQVTCNSTADDSVAGTDEYDWYLSQRTDDPAKQYWLALDYNPGGGNTASGTISLVHSALATSELGVVDGPLPAQQYHDLLYKVALYVRRISDGAIQWLDLHKALTGNA